jgi:hypothetical protein
MPCMKHHPLKSVGAEKTKDHDSRIIGQNRQGFHQGG